MRFVQALLVFFCCFSTSHANENQDINQKINANYVQFVNAFDKLNADSLLPIYDRNATYIPEHKEGELIQGKEEINLIYQRFFNRVKQKKAKVNIGFRLTSRDISQDRVTDIGYYLIRFTPAAHTEQPVSEFSGKFLIISKLNEKNQWQWFTEMNNKAKSEFYFGVTPKAGLFYTDSKPLKREDK